MKKENVPNTSTLKPLGKINENQKLPKPLIEKKRRARINRSLSDLRMLISDLLKKELMRTRSKRKSGKVEKADILELTVQYIKEMKQEKSVAKELAFEQGYQLCQINVDNYFRKINDLNSKQQSTDDKSTEWTRDPYLVRKDLLKTLDQQWTEHVKTTNYNRKADDQRGQPNVLSSDQLKNQLAVDQAYIEKSAAANKLCSNNYQKSIENLSSINPNNSINEQMNHLTLQNLNSSKNQSFNSPIPVKKFYPTMWKDKPLSKADELISIKLYNEIVMHNLNRNKSLCSSASSTSSCSSGSIGSSSVGTSYAKTINNLTNNYLSSSSSSSNHNQNFVNNQSLPHVMPTDLNTNYPSSSASSCCSVNSFTSSSVQNSNISSNKESDRSSSNQALPKYSHYANSPFKKRKKIYQMTFDAETTLCDRIDDSLETGVWRPW